MEVSSTPRLTQQCGHVSSGTGFQSAIDHPSEAIPALEVIEGFERIGDPFERRPHADPIDDL